MVDRATWIHNIRWKPRKIEQATGSVQLVGEAQYNVDAKASHKVCVQCYCCCSLAHVARHANTWTFTFDACNSVRTVRSSCGWDLYLISFFHLYFCMGMYATFVHLFATLAVCTVCSATNNNSERSVIRLRFKCSHEKHYWSFRYENSMRTHLRNENSWGIADY